MLTVLLFLLGLAGAYYLSQYVAIKAQYGILLYVWHSIFVYAFYLYVNAYGGDAVDYYNQTMPISAGGLGSGLVLSTVGAMTEGLAFSMLDCSIVFGFVGYAALLLWMKQLLDVTSGSQLLRGVCFALIFLPSFSFWSAGIGKDVVSLLAMALVVSAVLGKDLNHKLMLLAVLTMALVRPHVALIIGMVYLGACVGFELPSRSLKILMLSIAAAFIALMHEYFLKYVGYLDAVGKVAYEGGVVGYFEKISSLNSVAQSGIGLDSVGLPYLLFGYFLRPTLLEAQSNLQMMVGIENCVLFILFLLMVINGWRAGFVEVIYSRWFFLLLCAASISIGYAMISSNFGIAERTKWVVVPLIFILVRLRPARHSVP